jgi:hypothetical protein
MKPFLSYILLFIIALQGYCQPYTLSDRDDLAYFPNSINSVWTYERRDEMSNITDIVIVKITGDTLIGENTFMIWEYDYDHGTEKFYYSLSPDTIKVIDTRMEIVTMYIIPFEFEFGIKYRVVDDVFHQRFKDNWIEVLDRHEVMIGSSLFRTIMIKRKADGYNEYLTEKIWFVKKLGIIKMERHCWSIGCHFNESWKLISCHVE